jgi:hypothetical protein
MRSPFRTMSNYFQTQIAPSLHKRYENHETKKETCKNLKTEKTTPRFVSTLLFQLVDRIDATQHTAKMERKSH